jgi:hypothetical protein
MFVTAVWPVTTAQRRPQSVTQAGTCPGLAGAAWLHPVTASATSRTRQPTAIHIPTRTDETLPHDHRVPLVNPRLLPGDGVRSAVPGWWVNVCPRPPAEEFAKLGDQHD